MSWASIQLGSREHYAVPVALHEVGCLDCLITDTWLSKAASRAVRKIVPSLAGRRNDKLPDEQVFSRTAGRLLIDARMRFAGLGYWDKIMERNKWFQRWASDVLAVASAETVFSYSYTARSPFLAASKRGARCILGQIDPGPREEYIVEERSSEYRHLAPPADLAPKRYWEMWREEVALADRIVVNSPWSAELLMEEGVDPVKLVEIPLVYERAESSVDSLQSSEASGSIEHGAGSVERIPSKRLKALFLGSVILRKGVGQLFDAIKILKNEPVDFIFAGPVGVKIPDEISSMPNVRFLGPVDKATAEHLYRESDVFLFPTLSDGFGLTQLEALAHGLPVIASTHCGQVVEDDINGLVLEEVMPQSIADAIMRVARDREFLKKLQVNAHVPEQHRPRRLGPALLSCARG